MHEVFKFFSNKELLKKHQQLCNNPRGQAEFYPEPGQKVTFTHWNRKFENEVCGFLDFETVQVDNPENPDIKNLRAYQYGLIFVDKENQIIFEERKFEINKLTIMEYNLDFAFPNSTQFRLLT